MTNITKLDIINTTLAIILILTLGSISGYTLGYYRATSNQFPEIQFVKDLNEGVATIKLMESANGKLTGKVDGRNARIAYRSDRILELEEGSEFEIPLNEVDLKTYYQTADVPKEALFAASKNGKYYYSVFSNRTYQLSPKTRIYFSTKEEAERAGYLAK